MTDGGSRFPFLVSGREGDGMSAVIMGFPVWRWRLAGERGAGAYDGLFGGMIQYLAEGRKAPAIDVQTDRTVYRTGEAPRIRIFPSTDRASRGLRGEIARAGDDGPPVETFIPEPDPERRGAWTAGTGALPPGDYTVRVSAGDGESVGTAAGGESSFTVEPLSVEMLRTAGDADLLSRLAAESGGRAVDPSDPASIASMLDLAEDSVVSTTAMKIRGSLWLFLAIIIAFGTEWLLRKIFGLV
jgi:hypothetical protein